MQTDRNKHPPSGNLCVSPPKIDPVLGGHTRINTAPLRRTPTPAPRRHKPWGDSFRVSLATPQPGSAPSARPSHQLKPPADAGSSLSDAMMSDTEHWKPPSWSTPTEACDWLLGRTGAVKAANRMRRWSDGSGCSLVNTHRDALRASCWIRSPCPEVDCRSEAKQVVKWRDRFPHCRRTRVQTSDPETGVTPSPVTRGVLLT